ncbi:hypothetical protein [Williamsia sp.]|uniref:hypothetical protein n=1 Tax=Williamsia sp. TaxID=1872085 RepID=UPI0039C9D5BD
MWPQYAAGFTTAFGAQGIAANLGAFSDDAVSSLLVLALAASTPKERMGQAMGSAELGRELGDAGGLLLVAGVATVTTLAFGYAALAVLLAAAPVLFALTRVRDVRSRRG